VPTTSSLEILEPFAVKNQRWEHRAVIAEKLNTIFEFSVLLLCTDSKIDQEAQGLYSVEHNYAYVDYMLTDDKSAPSIRCVPTGIWLNSENS
jgi:hypothetical protein